jgi:hypothetical protein
MPTKKLAPMPDPLGYLQPFVNALARLPPDCLNEDVEPSRLEAALRKRIRGLDVENAEAQLAHDRERLKRWLENKPEHPAHWILGFMQSTLAKDIMQQAEPLPPGSTEPTPTEPAPHGPRIGFVPPNGWKVKLLAPYLLELKKGKLSGTIMAIDEALFHRTQRDRENWVVAPGVEATREVQDVQYGDASGKKYVYRRVSPDPSKRVDYVLVVPGGFAMAGIEATGVDFDVVQFEAQLHTTRVSASA